MPDPLLSSVIKQILSFLQDDDRPAEPPAAAAAAPAADPRPASAAAPASLPGPAATAAADAADASGPIAARQAAHCQSLFSVLVTRSMPNAERPAVAPAAAAPTLPLPPAPTPTPTLSASQRLQVTSTLNLLPVALEQLGDELAQPLPAAAWYDASAVRDPAAATARSRATAAASAQAVRDVTGRVCLYRRYRPRPVAPPTASAEALATAPPPPPPSIAATPCPPLTFRAWLIVFLIGRAINPVYREHRDDLLELLMDRWRASRLHVAERLALLDLVADLVDVLRAPPLAARPSRGASRASTATVGPRKLTGAKPPPAGVVPYRIVRLMARSEGATPVRIDQITLESPIAVLESDAMLMDLYRQWLDDAPLLRADYAVRLPRRLAPAVVIDAADHRPRGHEAAAAASHRAQYAAHRATLRVLAQALPSTTHPLARTRLLQTAQAETYRLGRLLRHESTTAQGPDLVLDDAISRLFLAATVSAPLSPLSPVMPRGPYSGERRLSDPEDTMAGLHSTQFQLALPFPTAWTAFAAPWPITLHDGDSETDEALHQLTAMLRTPASPEQDPDTTRVGLVLQGDTDLPMRDGEAAATPSKRAFPAHDAARSHAVDAAMTDAAAATADVEMDTDVPSRPHKRPLIQRPSALSSSTSSSETGTASTAATAATTATSSSAMSSHATSSSSLSSPLGGGSASSSTPRLADLPQAGGWVDAVQQLDTMLAGPLRSDLLRVGTIDAAPPAAANDTDADPLAAQRQRYARHVVTIAFMIPNMYGQTAAAAVLHYAVNRVQQCAASLSKATLSPNDVATLFLKHIPFILLVIRQAGHWLDPERADAASEVWRPAQAMHATVEWAIAWTLLATSAPRVSALSEMDPSDREAFAWISQGMLRGAAASESVSDACRSISQACVDPVRWATWHRAMQHLTALSTSARDGACSLSDLHRRVIQTCVKRSYRCFTHTVPHLSLVLAARTPLLTVPAPTSTETDRAAPEGDPVAHRLLALITTVTSLADALVVAEQPAPDLRVIEQSIATIRRAVAALAEGPAVATTPALSHAWSRLFEALQRLNCASAQTQHRGRAVSPDEWSASPRPTCSACGRQTAASLATAYPALLNEGAWSPLLHAWVLDDQAPLALRLGAVQTIQSLMAHTPPAVTDERVDLMALIFDLIAQPEPRLAHEAVPLAAALYLHRSDLRVPSSVHSQPAHGTLIVQLERVLDAASRSLSEEVAIAALARIGSCGQERALVAVLMVLLGQIHPKRLLSNALIIEHLHQMAERLDQRLVDLFLIHAAALAPAFAQLFSEDPDGFKMIIDSTGIALKEFCNRLLQDLLPQMVLLRDAKALHALAKLTQRSVQDLLITDIGYILSEFFLRFEQDTALFLIEQTSSPTMRMTLAQFVRSCPLLLLNQLVFRLWDGNDVSEQALRAILVIRETLTLSPKSSQSQQISSHTGQPAGQANGGAAAAASPELEMETRLLDEAAYTLIGDFLAPYLLGLLSGIGDAVGEGAHLRPATARIAHIRSLGVLLRIMGDRARNALPQVISTLQSGLEDTTAHRVAIRCATLAAWKDFASYISPMLLQPHLPHILACVLNNYDDALPMVREASVLVVNTLFARGEAVYPDETFALMCDIPDDPSLARWQVHTNHCRKRYRVSLRYEAKSQSQAGQFINEPWYMEHPTLSRLPDIRRILDASSLILLKACLHDLQRLCHTNGGELLRLLVDSNSPGLTEVVLSLRTKLLEMACARSAARDTLQQYLIQCLAFFQPLEALHNSFDPHSLGPNAETASPPKPNRQMVAAATLFPNIRDTEATLAAKETPAHVWRLAMTMLITQVIPAFRAARDTHFQDHLAYTIQETLTFCGLRAKLVDEAEKFRDLLTAQHFEASFSAQGPGTHLARAASKTSVVDSPASSTVGNGGAVPRRGSTLLRTYTGLTETDFRYTPFEGLPIESIQHIPSPELQIMAMWLQLTPSEVEIVQPFLRTRYSIITPPAVTTPTPVYTHQTTFFGWLVSFTTHLVRCLPSGDHLRRYVTDVARNLLENPESGLAPFLFPHVCFQVLASRSGLLTDMVAAAGVPAPTGRMGDLTVVTDEFRLILDDMPHFLVSSDAVQQGLVHAVKSRASLTEKQLLCCRQLFTFLDQLQACQTEQTKIAIARTSERTPRNLARHDSASKLAKGPQVNEALQNMIDHCMKALPNVTLANAAFHCGDFARAVSYFETHIRHMRLNASEESLQPLYSDLQRLYRYLDEPDGLEGISTKFLHPSLEQQILDHEVAGRWNSAQTCWEILSAQTPHPRDRVACSVGILMSQSRMGHYEAVLSQLNGMLPPPPSRTAPLTMGLPSQAGGATTHPLDDLDAHQVSQAAATDPDLKRSIAKIQCEAAWRLQQWDVIERKMVDDGATVAPRSALAGIPEPISPPSSHVLVSLQQVIPGLASTPFEVGLAYVLYLIKQHQFPQAEAVIAELRMNLSRALSTLMQDYNHVQHEITGALAILGDIDLFLQVLASYSDDTDGHQHPAARFAEAQAAILAAAPSALRPITLSTRAFDEIVQNWDLRFLLASGHGVTVQEPRLAVQRTLLSALAVDGASKHPVLGRRIQYHIGRLWLQTARVNRQAHYREPALQAILQATSLKTPYAFVERAKWLKQGNQTQRAIFELRTAIDTLMETESQAQADPKQPKPSKLDAWTSGLNFAAAMHASYADLFGTPELMALQPASEKLYLRTKTQLTLAGYLEESNSGNPAMIASIYNLALGRENMELERTCYHFGRFYNKCYDKDRENIKQQELIAAANPKAAGTASGMKRAGSRSTVIDVTGPGSPKAIDPERDEGASDRFKATMPVMDAARADAIIDASQMAMKVITMYIRALRLGTKYIDHTLPRLLTLWLDEGSRVMQAAAMPKELQARAKQHERLIRTMNQLVSDARSQLPTWQFMTALPQLTSRINHKTTFVYDVLKDILVTTLVVYPHQTIWHLLPLGKSKKKIQQQRCKQVYALARSEDLWQDPNDARSQATDRAGHAAAAAGSGTKAPRSVGDRIEVAVRLCDHLLNICELPIQKQENSFRLSVHFRTLLKIMPMDVLIPLQNSMTVTLPRLVASSYLRHQAHDPTLHKPFPRSLPTIHTFQDEVGVMTSLIRPRKLTIIGSDGHQYHFLCKPKDDLRKDARFMEFAGIISRLLQRDEQSRGRGLRIRTYAVTPISEECGLIQWVPATTGFRIIVQQRYTARGMGLPSSAIRAIAERRGKDWNKRLHAFVHDLLPPHPPIFYTWFHEMFGTPQRWLAARSRYAATMATMSIVGWIIGLGDRHGENILFDEKSGDCVHVDLNCLFEKGLTLAEPELVPFRLTHNLTDALGVTGVEGPFRRGCESVYRVMREHRDALNAVLETFLHDPLCEWGKSLRFAAGHTGSLVEKQQAMEVEQAAKALATIDRKLLGIDKVSIPLSVEGQVQELIRAATDVNLLAQMYIGWGSYL